MKQTKPKKTKEIRLWAIVKKGEIVGDYQLLVFTSKEYALSDKFTGEKVVPVSIKILKK